MRSAPSAADVARAFRFDGSPVSVSRYGSGHINDTYCVVIECGLAQRRFILQRINPSIFPDPAPLMENIERVTAHLAARLDGRVGSERRVLSLVKTLDGGAYHQDAEGAAWRAFPFVDRTVTRDAVDTPQQAFEAANAFGDFQRSLATLPPPRLHETIANFHNTPLRFAALESAIAADPHGRTAGAMREIRFALDRAPQAGALLRGELPERVTHNDAKLNNVLFDEITGEAVCVADLDTVMPGIALCDFGDLVRTGTVRAGEDERDLSKVEMEFPLFEALTRGYFASAAGFLTRGEKRSLAIAGTIITLEQGVRFLTDYLAGDLYYKTCREGQNLDRCRTQFKLVESIERQRDRMERLVESVADQ